MEEPLSVDELTDSDVQRVALLVLARKAQRTYPTLARRANDLAARLGPE